MKTKKHWYFITIRKCCLCGKTYEYRERRYTKKPKDRSKCIDYSNQTACSSHFI
jgi:hypothetical protein